MESTGGELKEVSIAEFESHVLRKVESDLEFRQRLIADPKGVIEAETGQPLPDDFMVYVGEAISTAQKAVPSVDAPLTEEELIEVVAGCEGTEIHNFSGIPGWTWCSTGGD